MATTPRTRAPKTAEDVPMPTPPPAPDTVADGPAGAPPASIFDTIRFPSRGRSTENVDMDERVSEALERRRTYMAQGVDPTKILTVVDLTPEEGEDAAKVAEKFRSQLGNAVSRLGDTWKLEWRTIADNARTRETYADFERQFGTDIKNATHTFRLVPRNGGDPHAAPVAE